MAGGAEPETTAVDVVALADLADSLAVTIWIDGGWGVDALLRRQTRRHADLDIALTVDHAPTLADALRAHGYGHVACEGSQPWNFVLGDAAGRQVDFHLIVLDGAGNGVYGPPENSEQYPAAALTGSGAIAGRGVRCISAEWLVRFHTGYAVDAEDWADVAALCAAFDLPIPDDYRRFRS